MPFLISDISIYIYISIIKEKTCTLLLLIIKQKIYYFPSNLDIASGIHGDEGRELCFLYTFGLYTPKVVHFIEEEVFVVKMSHTEHTEFRWRV